MPAEDWQRLQEMQAAALKKQSEALSELLTWLQERNAYEDSLIVVLGDVGAGERPTIPFEPEAELHEATLRLRLRLRAHQRPQHVEEVRL